MQKIQKNTLIKHFFSLSSLKIRVLLELQSDCDINLICFFQNILHLGDKIWLYGPTDMELD